MNKSVHFMDTSEQLVRGQDYLYSEFEHNLTARTSEIGYTIEKSDGCGSWAEISLSAA